MPVENVRKKSIDMKSGITQSFSLFCKQLDNSFVHLSRSDGVSTLNEMNEINCRTIFDSHTIGLSYNRIKLKV